MQHKLRWFRSRSLSNMGLAFRELREERGFTQEDFAVTLKCSRATIGRLERGDAVTSTVLIRAAAELGHEFVLVPRTGRVIVERLEL